MATRVCAPDTRSRNSVRGTGLTDFFSALNGGGGERHNNEIILKTPILSYAGFVRIAWFYVKIN